MGKTYRMVAAEPALRAGRAALDSIVTAARRVDGDGLWKREFVGKQAIRRHQGARSEVFAGKSFPHSRHSAKFAL